MSFGCRRKRLQIEWINRTYRVCCRKSSVATCCHFQGRRCWCCIGLFLWVHPPHALRQGKKTDVTAGTVTLVQQCFFPREGLWDTILRTSMITVSQRAVLKCSIPSSSVSSLSVVGKKKSLNCECEQATDNRVCTCRGWMCQLLRSQQAAYLLAAANVLWF